MELQCRELCLMGLSRGLRVRLLTCARMGARRIERVEGEEPHGAALWVRGRAEEVAVSTRPNSMAAGCMANEVREVC